MQFSSNINLFISFLNLKIFFFDIFVYYIVLVLFYFVQCFYQLFGKFIYSRFIIINIQFQQLLHTSLVLLYINNQLIFILLLEFFSFIIYFLLIGGLNLDLDRSEGVIKYFYLNTYGTLLFLLSSSFLYLLSNDIHFYNIFLMNNFFYSLIQFYVFLFILLCSFLFKLSIFPFFIQIIDIYDISVQQLHIIMLLYIKNIYIFLFLKFLIIVVYKCLNSLFFLIIFKILLFSFILGTLFCGVFLTITTFKFKRILAIISISHVSQLLILLLYQLYFDFFLFFLFFCVVYFIRYFYLYVYK